MLCGSLVWMAIGTVAASSARTGASSSITASACSEIGRPANRLVRTLSQMSAFGSAAAAGTTASELTQARIAATTSP